MLVVGVLAAFVALVALLTRLDGGRHLRITSCCAARPWPPTDLTDEPPSGRGAPSSDAG